MNLRPYLSVAALLALGSGCATHMPGDEIPPDLGPGHFSICYNHGCADTAQVRLSPTQWREIRARFDPPPSSARWSA